MECSPVVLSTFLLPALLLAGCGGLDEEVPAHLDAAVLAGSEPSVILLVRHAERAPEPEDDPGLTAVGAERARELARLLVDAGITRIHSTDTRRTRETAGPLAEVLALPVELYDASDLGAVARDLLASPGRHLVVGHSNTTPELAAALGGERHGPIHEGWEYDRLYLLTPDPGGSVGTVLLRFGPPVVRP
jgi:2,3-bisphosphoglycerate-dependent phosphoglycerate mutase